LPAGPEPLIFTLSAIEGKNELCSCHTRSGANAVPTAQELWVRGTILGLLVCGGVGPPWQWLVDAGGLEAAECAAKRKDQDWPEGPAVFSVMVDGELGGV
jgi:hypothetical protein